MNSSSRLIEEAVDQVSSLPGVGRKTALRFVLDLLRRKPEEVMRFAESLITLRDNIRYCKTCHNLSDEEECSICKTPRRDNGLLCVVQDIRDVMAIEGTGQFSGRYHVLGGIISPMDGISPSQLNIDSLVERVAGSEVKEVILALSATMEGETTSFYLFKKLSPLNVAVSTIARGVAVGGELEYTDEVTLGRSILLRTPYESSLKR
ncbi:MAG: recombination protein RecR [Crocinitomicaceae bacterium]|nr:recombination protein RecR [Crocinitomicaceae bacterium]